MINQEVPQADQSSEKDPVKSLQRIRSQISEYSKQITETKKAIIILGDTGEGKSTLAHFLANNLLIAFKNKFFKGFFLVPEKPLNNIQIGTSCSSQTTTPNIWVDPGGTVYCDCPGFNDTKGVEQDITNGFYINKIFETSAELKIIIVISQKSIQIRADKFIGVLKKIEKLFVDLTKILDSICLVLTQTSLQSPNKFRKYLKEYILASLKNNLSENLTLLISHFASGNGQVAVFPSPLKEGPIDMQGNRLIKQSIEKTRWITKPSIRITVSPDSQLALEKFGGIINSEIEKICDKTNKFLAQRCELIKQKVNNYSLAKQKLQQFGSSIKRVKRSKDINQFIKNFNDLINEYNLDLNLIKQLSDGVKQLTFIQKIKPQTTMNFHKWIANIMVDQLIDMLIKEPEIEFSKDKNILYIKAPMIGISKIKEILTSSSSIQFVNVFCLDNFFIDADLFAPGINLSIFAQNWRIPDQQKIISLKGRNAQNYDHPAQSPQDYDEDGNGLKGQNGLPRKPGQTGGSFLGKNMSSSWIDVKNLKIDVRGGNGGNGQSAGNGSDGKNGKDASELPVRTRDKQNLQNTQDYKQEQIGFGTLFRKALTVNKKKLETYVSKGQEGKRGGNSGKRGAQGLGGYSGQIMLVSMNVKISQGDGIQGLAGQLGRPGEGGRNGRTYKGRFLREVIDVKDELQNIRQLQNSATKYLSSTALSAKILIGIPATLVSSSWLDRQYEDGGRAPSGQIIMDLNYKDRQQPSLPFEHKYAYLSTLQDCYKRYRQEFFRLINRQTTSLDMKSIKQVK